MQGKAESGKQKIRPMAQITALDELEARLLRTTSGPDSTSIGLLLLEVKAVGRAPRQEEFGEVARTLSRMVRQNDAIARFDATSFVVLLTGLTGSEDARVVAERVHYALTQSGDSWRVCLGLSLVGAGKVDLPEVWARARRELEVARDSGAWFVRAPVETLRVRSTG